MYTNIYDAASNKLQSLVIVLDLLIDDKHVDKQVIRNAQQGIFELLTWAKEQPSTMAHNWQYGEEPTFNSEQMAEIDRILDDPTYYKLKVPDGILTLLRYTRNRLAAAEMAARGMRKVLDMAKVGK